MGMTIHNLHVWLIIDRHVVHAVVEIVEIIAVEAIIVVHIVGNTNNRSIRIWVMVCM
jgi:hypothetical protein